MPSRLVPHPLSLPVPPLLALVLDSCAGAPQPAAEHPEPITAAEASSAPNAETEESTPSIARDEEHSSESQGGEAASEVEQGLPPGRYWVRMQSRYRGGGGGGYTDPQGVRFTSFHGAASVR